MTVATSGHTVTNTRTTKVEQQVEWEPRPSEPSWWQTRQDRDVLVGRLLGLFTDPGAGRTRDKTRRRGLAKQMPRLESIHANLVNRLEEAKGQGWLGEVAAIETTRAAAEQKLSAMRSAAAQHTTTTLGMPGFGPAAGRASSNG